MSATYSMATYGTDILASGIRENKRTMKYILLK